MFHDRILFLQGSRGRICAFAREAFAVLNDEERGECSMRGRDRWSAFWLAWLIATCAVVTPGLVFLALEQLRSNF